LYENNLDIINLLYKLFFLSEWITF